jgi:hypothetical protein
MEDKVSEQLKKIVQSMNYLLAKTDAGLDKILIMKMLWAADRYHLRRYGRLVTLDTYCAMPKGPVPSLALDTLSCNEDIIGEESSAYSKEFIDIPGNFHRFKSIKPPDGDVLSATDTEALDFAYGLMSQYAGNNSEVVNFTHKYPEWKRFENILSSIKTSISMDMLDFFKNPDKTDVPEDRFGLDSAILENNRELYEESQEIKQFLYI